MTSLAMAEVKARPVIAAGCRDGYVRLSDLASGAQVGEALGAVRMGGSEDLGIANYQAVRAVRVAVLDGQQVLIAGYGGTVHFTSTDAAATGKNGPAGCCQLGPKSLSVNWRGARRPAMRR